jgi:hypothetical protein
MGFTSLLTFDWPPQKTGGRRAMVPDLGADSTVKAHPPPAHYYDPTGTPAFKTQIWL